MENSLPNSWVETTLGEIADWGSGGTPKATESKYYGGNIPWLIIGDLNDGEIAESQKRITQAGLDNSSAKWVPVDAVLVAMYGSIGKLGIAKIRCTTNQAIAFTQRIHGGIPNKFLYYYLYSKKQYLLDIGKGGTQANISQTVLKGVPFPLPPLAEQHRIVAKLDELMEKIDSSRARLERIPQILKRFRQSVLAAAVSGKLTEEWRENRSLSHNFDTYGFEKDEKGWVELKASDACVDVASGSTPPNSPFTRTGDIPFLKVYNIVNQEINFDYKPQFVSRELHETKLKRCKLFPNDVIINIVGPPLGKVALVTNQYPEWNMNQALVLFRPKEYLLPKYLFCILNEGSEIKRLENEYRGSAGQTNISLTQCRNFIFTVPTIEEQKEIIKRIEKLFGFASKIEARYMKARTQLDVMPQSILAKAFRGGLVDQDENDESASTLLERIRQSRHASKGKSYKLDQEVRMAAEP